MTTNIIFLVIDSFRSDRFFGSDRSCKTPNIDSLINRGLYCKNTIGGADSTGIAIGNCITGKYSFKNGINQIDLNSKTITLFDILKNHGYSLYATIPDLTWFNHLTKNFNEHDNFFCANLIQDDLTKKVGSQILKRLSNKQMKEPWFYYIHLADLHQKIIVPKIFDDKKFGNTKYDRMVSCVDNWIGKIVNQVDLNNTLLVITADHGDYIPIIEQFGEISFIKKIMQKTKKYFPFLESLGLKLFISLRDYSKKSQIKEMKKTLSKEELRSLTPRCGKELYDEALRVPLLFVGGQIQKPIILEDLVGGVDIFSTILSLVDIKHQKSKLDGRNLSVIFNDEKINEKALYIESSNNEEFRNGFLEGIRTSKFKYLRAKEDPKNFVTLFNMEKDPDEFHNISNNEPEIIKEMEKLLDELKNQNIMKPGSDIPSEDEEKIRQELKKMGYI
jgi:arylsulfatase A-like enzyme